MMKVLSGLASETQTVLMKCRMRLLARLGEAAAGKAMKKEMALIK